jgi:gliding motility-associated-like protein
MELMPCLKPLINHVFQQKSILIILSFCIGLNNSVGQIPSALQLNKHTSPQKNQSDCQNFAGTTGFGIFKGQSFTLRRDNIILCFGDSLQIIHNGNANVSNDPNPLTMPGIAYAMYLCQPNPSFSGPGILQITKDPCLNKLPTFQNNPLRDSFWITKDKMNGDIALFNQGDLQQGFNQGKPIRLWFAPITLDFFDESKIESGSICTHVNASDAFSVTYLNPITVQELTVDHTKSCENAMIIKGGLPEFDTLTTYQVEIFLKSNIQIKGIVQNFTKHNDTLLFSVPQPGDYWVQITDNTGCERIFDINIANCPALFIDLPRLNVSENSDFCVPIKVKNFEKILSVQFALSWDSTVLEYIRVELPNILPNLDPSKLYKYDLQSLHFSWDDISFLGLSIPDDSTIFQVCFNAMGKLDDCSKLEIIGKMDFPVEVVDTSTREIGLIAETGTICISNSPLLIETSIKPIACKGENNGEIRLKIFGGFPPYLVHFENKTDTVFEDSESITYKSLTAGSYNFTVIDSAGNDKIFALTLDEGTEIEITSTAISPQCFGGNDGKIIPSVKINGLEKNPLEGNYLFSWNTGQPDLEQSELKSGTYQLSITHQNECTEKHIVTLIDPDIFKIDSISTKLPDCVGFANGTITSYISGGSQPYSYSLFGEGKNITQPSIDFDSLTSGQYELIFKDSLGCSELRDTIQLSDPAAIKIEFSNIKPVSCHSGRSDGEALATAEYVDKKTGNFKFIWNPSNPNLIDEDVIFSLGRNLTTGYHQVDAIDENNCSGFDSVFIPAPDPISVTTQLIQPSCHDSSDGSLTANPSGGTPAYSIKWLHSGASGSNTSNISIGSYDVEITDANGCTLNQSLFLSGPSKLQLFVDSLNSKDVSCFAGEDGRIALNYNAGDPINPVGMNAFDWSLGIGNASSGTAEGLKSGTYRVTLTDSKGCQDSLSITINEPMPVEADIEITQSALCYGDPSVLTVQSVTGGNGSGLRDYQYMVSGSTLIYSADQTALVFDGLYEITVTDKKGCSYIESIQVIGPDSLSIAFNPSIISLLLGEENTILDPLIFSKLPIISYQWTPSEGLSSSTVKNPKVALIEDKLFELTIQDANGCTAEASVQVRVDKSKKLFLPNVFSPNNDGVNDEFILYGCTGIKNVNKFLLFDRWGDLLLSKEEFNTPDCYHGLLLWDGKLDNKSMQEGSYIYAIEVTFLDDVTLLFKGEVVLMQ